MRGAPVAWNSRNADVCKPRYTCARAPTQRDLCSQRASGIKLPHQVVVVPIWRARQQELNGFMKGLVRRLYPAVVLQRKALFPDQKHNGLSVTMRVACGALKGKTKKRCGATA